MSAETDAAYAAGLEHGKRYEREMCALLVDQLGREGCSFFRLVLEIRRRTLINEDQKTRHVNGMGSQARLVLSKPGTVGQFWDDSSGCEFSLD